MVQFIEALGRSELADRLFGQLADGHNCWLSGPSGAGKTELARHLAKLWAATKGDVRWIEGDRDQTATSYLAANRALAATRHGRNVRDADKDLPIAMIRAIPYFGGPISALAKMIIARAESNGPDFLSAEQQDLLTGFQKACTSERILFLIDNVHWLDSSTAGLLHRMSSPEVAECYSFIGRTTFLFIETTDQDEVSAAEIITLLKPCAVASFAVSFPPRTAFPTILEALGLERHLESEVYDHLYELTRGHLRLAKEIVRLIQDDVPASMLANEQAPTTIDIAEKLIRLRLETLPTEATTLQKLLGLAACIGQHFSRAELECAFSDRERFSAALNLARREEYLSGDGDTLQFAHEIIRAALKSFDQMESASFHDKLAECVRHLRPGDYRSRLRHSALTSDHTRTAALAFALRLQEARGEIALEPGIDRPDDVLLAAALPAFKAVTSALNAMDQAQYGHAIRILVSFYTSEPTAIQGEIAYLLALNYYKKRTVADYENARALLEPWITRRQEGELWYRLMLTLAVVYASLGDKRSSSETLTRVRTYLEKSVDRDSTARAKIHILNRKAEIFYPLEVAGALIKSAVDYFSPSSGAEIPRNAFQYAAALINLSGNLYVRGDFSDAVEVADRAARCITALSDRMRVPEPYKAFNNYSISSLRAGQSNPESALEILETIAQKIETPERLDHSLLSINRGALNFLAGRIAEADAIFERTYTSIKNDHVDGYYFVFAASNWAGSQYLLGSPEHALKLVEEVEERLDEFPNELRRTFMLRQQAIRSAISEARIKEALEWDRFPQVVSGKDGPHVAWRSLGWGMIMSDIQVWSES